jgi:hypothetical protein
MSCIFCLFFKCFIPKTYFLKVLNGPLFIWILWVVFLGLPSFKKKLVTLNTNFHIDLGRFMGD